MPLGTGGGGGGKVGTGFVKIKPDAEGFGNELDRTVGKEAETRSGLIGGKASMAFKGAFLAGTATMAKGVLDFASFDAGMREVFTLMPDLSESAMGDMTEDVKGFASEFGVIPNEVIPALYDSISAGVPTDNVFDFLEQAQKLAKGGATDLSTAVDGLSSVVNAYGPEALSAAEASDSLFTAVKLGKTTVDEMSSSLFQVAPIAAATGIGFDEVTASIATLTSQGTPTSVAATQMKGAIAELGKEGSKAWSAFEEATGKTFPAFIDEGGTLTDALGLMSEFADENDTSISNMFGSLEAGQAALGIVKDLDKANENLRAVGDSAGATDKAFETMNEGLAATMDRLKAKFAVTLIDLGTSLAPTIETAGMAIAGLVDMFTALPAPMRTGIILFGTLAAGALAFAGPMLKLVKTAKLLGSAMTLLAANPWALVLIALAAGALLVIKNWDEVKEFLGDLWGWITDAAGAVGDFFVDLWEAVSGAVITAWDATVGGIMTALDAIGTAVVAAWDAVTTATVAAWDAVTGAIVTAWDAITGAVTTAVEAVGSAIETGFEFVASVVTTYVEIYRSIIETGWNLIQSVVTSVVDGITFAVDAGFALVTSVVTTATDLARAAIELGWNTAKAAVGLAIDGIMAWVDGFLNIPNLITDAFSGLADAIAAPFRAAFNSIKSAWNNTVGGFSVSIPSVMGFGGASFSIPSMARGGIASDPMLALIGDAGPRDDEIVTPESLMRSVVGDALADAGGSGLHIETHLHVDGTTDASTFERMLETASVEIVRVVQRELDRQRSAQGRPAGAIAA